ncbi:hypothetical protein KC340_g980 [Hortaea werneckii]|nr:hypothetical protein KC342_g596 [Hortaea werneckii]KAI7108959.1 hypothetical protein KC339_g1125 [Hortaea werneckii]KAI7230026.1 hypothetical protein KC365_g7802 [Hortaea werneckii]KAI7338348.1 hypothetical protein KC340_g980 [Hortaea werneckii]KAI7408022.1 hypothetical protein KC328_g214 [Hortaea werneckii]
MPAKTLARALPYFSRPTPGFQLFHSEQRQSPDTTHPRYNGPVKRLAHRGTEVFVAVGTELRWADLEQLKSAGEVWDRSHGMDEPAEDQEAEEEDRRYRVLKTSVARPIQQLSVSPSGDFIAILTSHTCHVATLPSASHLTSGSYEPLRIKTYQVGPTAHVLEQSPLVSALWHPLSPSGNCLVTVARDACVRLWELERSDLSSFDEPSLAVDLKKLANATTTQADFSASKYGVNKGFSPDNVEMDVHAACFGGSGTDDESGWAAMTLWIAMGEGDVYALCPFLPSKWRATSTLLPSLSTSVVAKTRAISHDPEATEDEKRVSDQQTRWLADLDEQEPMSLPGATEFDLVDVYNRPARPGALPKLQGPFYVGTDNDIGEITDIHVIGAKINDESLYDEDEVVDEEPGLSVGIVCVATSTSKVHVCLDLDGVEAEWLPTKRAPRNDSSFYTFSDEDVERSLLVYETLDLSNPDVDVEGWPTFTLSPTNRYELLATTPSGVYTLDFQPWTQTLEDELAHAQEQGADFRFNILLESTATAITQPIRLTTESQQAINTAIAILSPAGLGGCLLLTLADPNCPLSALLALPLPPSNPYAPDASLTLPPSESRLLEAPEPRAPYLPAETFFTPTGLPAFAKEATQHHRLGPTAAGGQQIRYSPATLQFLTDAHRLIAAETHGLGLAASELFRRCERMRSELLDQIRRVREIRDKVDVVVGTDEGSEADSEGEGGSLEKKDRVEVRANEAHERTVELNERVERLRAKMGRLGGGASGGRPLSVREQGFAKEVERVSVSVGAGEEDGGGEKGTGMGLLPAPASERVGDGQSAGEGEHQQVGSSLVRRLQAAKELHERLVRQAGEAVESAEQRRGGAGEEGGSSATKRVAGGTAAAPVHGDFRRQKSQQVMALLERETALVEGVAERLARLGVSA